jgi:hypothetical protein
MSNNKRRRRRRRKNKQTVNRSMDKKEKER